MEKIINVFNNNIRVFVNNNFLNEINHIYDTKEKSHEIKDSINKQYISLVKEGKTLFNLVTKRKKADKIALAAEKFDKASKLKSNEAEPYFYLSLLYLITDDFDTGEHYYYLTKQHDHFFKGLEKIEHILEQNMIKKYNLNQPQAFKPETISNCKLSKKYLKYKKIKVCTSKSFVENINKDFEIKVNLKLGKKVSQFNKKVSIKK